VADLESFAIDANGLRFACLVAGPADGPLALCLHGFPDTAATWRHLLPTLAEAGYRAVAPFMRGFAPTGIPADGCYQLGALVRDATCLHEALGGDDQAVLLGHDWGALATYGALAHQPSRWRRAVAVAVPPLLATAASFFTYDQLRRSWYQFFFQSPAADGAVMADDYAFVGRLWADWSPGYDATADVARVKAALDGPERVAAALGYYRAVWGGGPVDDALAEEQAAVLAPTPVPTLYLHGADDGCMGLEIVEDPLASMAEGSAFEVVPGAGHFCHLEQPELVGRLVMAHLAS